MFKALLVVSMLFSSFAFAVDSYQVVNTKVNCVGANGVKIASKQGEPNTVSTTWLNYNKDFHYNMNPFFFQWTWIPLVQENQTAAQGYHIFLLGNPDPGKVATLYGSIGHIVSTPVMGGMVYPIGFVPHSAITCQVYWERK